MCRKKFVHYFNVCFCFFSHEVCGGAGDGAVNLLACLCEESQNFSLFPHVSNEGNNMSSL